jgi:hypothetical protein
LIGQFCTQQIQITKLCKNLLLTVRWENWYDSLTPEHCVHCGEPEDRDHIIKCSFQTRQCWHQSLISKLRKGHDSDSSDHYLLDILIKGLDCWFKGSWLQSNWFPRWYHKLIAEQSAIGWRHLFYGHLSIQWHTKQDYYIWRKKNDTLTHTGAGWSRRMLTIIWHKFWLLWKTRNETMHRLL